jgi:hypothetical protein
MTPTSTPQILTAACERWNTFYQANFEPSRGKSAVSKGGIHSVRTAVPLTATILVCFIRVKYGCLDASMTTESRIPFEELALTADEVGQLLGCTGRQVLERIACKPDFPARLSVRPASWIAREILEWREKNRADSRSRIR